MAIFPTIPDPTSDPKSHLPVLQAMKQAIELLTGQRHTGAKRVRMFRTNIRPGLPNSPVHISTIEDGDFWIDMSNSAKMNYWDATTMSWQPTT